MAIPHSQSLGMFCRRKQRRIDPVRPYKASPKAVKVHLLREGPPETVQLSLRVVREMC